MYIRTYDDKDEATFDLQGLAEYMQSKIDLEEQKKREKIAKAESYFQGFSDGIRAVAGIMEASNYRAKEKVSE